MLMEVKNYLKCELKVKPSEIEQLNILKIFHPAKDDWNTLYVELGNEAEVEFLYTFTKNIKEKDNRLFPYIPRQMYRRFRAAESFLYNIRQTEKVKTKVKIGLDDFTLATRIPGSKVWRNCPLPNNLPPIDHDIVHHTYRRNKQ